MPLIHNVMNTDVVVGVSDESTAALDRCSIAKPARYLIGRRRIDPALAPLCGFGLSSIANIVAAIKLAKRFGLGDDRSGRDRRDRRRRALPQRAQKYRADRYPDGFDEVSAGEIFGRHLLGVADNDVLELTHHDR